MPSSDIHLVPRRFSLRRAPIGSLVLLLFASAGLFRTALAEETPGTGLIDLHGEKVVLVEGTLSTDGRYAAGWTVHPKKGSAPVRWEDYGKEDSSLFDVFLAEDGYEIANVIVDLPQRTVVTALKFSEPYYHTKNHGALEVLYGPEREGRRYAVALSDGKWAALDVVLVELGPNGATQCDLHKNLDSAVAKYVHSQGGSGNYATDYQIFALPEVGLHTGFSDPTTVRVPFVSCIPKTSNEYDGSVLLRLSTENGKPRAEASVHETRETQNPLSDDPRVIAADKELNVAYAALRRRLDEPGKARLLAEQREWIKDRDNQVNTIGNDQSPLANARILADRLLLRLTQERTGVLQGR